DGVDGQHEAGGAGERPVADRDGDRRGSELVVRRGDGQGAAGPAAAEDDVRVRHQGGVRGGGRDRQRGRRVVHVPDGEPDRPGRRVLVGGLVGDGRDRRGVVDRGHGDGHVPGGCPTVAV